MLYSYPHVCVSRICFGRSVIFFCLKDFVCFFNVDHFYKVLLNLLQYCFCFLCFWFLWHVEILASQTGLESIPPATGRQSLNHWTAREVPQVIFFNFLKKVICCIFIFIQFKKFSFSFFWPHGMWDLVSPTRDQTCAPCIGSMES